MIATLTLNPAIDKNLEFDRLIPEKKMRCSAIKTEAGGGGINISKAIKELGGNSIAIYPSGGMNGERLKRLLEEKGISVCSIDISGDTRENFNADERSTHKQYRFITPGPVITTQELDRITERIEQLEGLTYLVCSGSLPEGVGVDYIKTIADVCKRKKARFIIDTSGEALETAISNGAFMVKPNVTELKSLAGKDYLDEAEIPSVAKTVMDKAKVETMVVSMGPAGALLVTKDQTMQFRAPTVKKMSTVGAGDSMVAGIVWMLENGHPLEDAVRFGIACGTAATMRTGSQLFRKEDADRLFTSITPLTSR